MDVTLKLLLDSGDIRAGSGVLHVSTRDQTRQADLDEDGIISFEGELHRSLSSFAVAAIRSCGAVGRKTANGWQVVNYRGRPLEQYRADFLEKQSQASDSSQEIEPVVRRVPRKKRRVSQTESLKRISASESEDIDRTETSTRSSDETLKQFLWTKAFVQKRIRPTRTWLDVKELTSDGMPSAKTGRCKASYTMHLTAAPIKRQTPEEEEEDARERLELDMWMKKALNKRHREEC